jgi:vacuolar-type H+-ATPase subunit H
MPGVRDLLDRFRPAGSPGAATAAGVPADRCAAVTAELEPVLAALARVERTCDELRRDAAEAATRRVTEAHGRARAIVAHAHSEAPSVRAAAAAQRREQAAAELTRLVADAEATADDERRRADERLPVLIDRVLAAVRADLAALDGAA